MMTFKALTAASKHIKRLKKKKREKKRRGDFLFVSRFGLAVRQRDLGSNLLWFSFHFKSCGLRTLSCDFVPRN